VTSPGDRGSRDVQTTGGDSNIDGTAAGSARTVSTGISACRITCSATEPSARMQEMLCAEAAERSNDIATYRAFYRRIRQMKQDNLAYLSAARQAGKTIFGFGAPVKGNTMLNYFGVGTDFIDCLVEKNTMRKGLYSPGMHIPVVIEDELNEPPNIYYVLAWNFKTEILKNNRQLLDRGVEFYFPVNPKEAGE